MLQPIRIFGCGNCSTAGFYGFSNQKQNSKMEIKKQVTQWVEKKFTKTISQDLAYYIQDENSEFDVESYVEDLIENLFKEEDGDTIKNEIINYNSQPNINRSTSDLSKEDIHPSNSLDSLVLEPIDFTNFSPTELINNLKSKKEEIRHKSLKTLEIIADDLVNQGSWQKIKKILQSFLEGKTDRKSQILTLKIFYKFMMCPNKPQAVCDSFITITEVVSYHIDLISTTDGKIAYEEIYDFKEDKWLNKKVPSKPKRMLNGFLKRSQQPLDNEVLIKSMWMLIECQKQMPEKWIRFNERRLREIIFSFIYLLTTSTTFTETEKFSGLELLSTLNPSASWCRHWCHTSVGRTLLCSALRKYKTFFIQMVEIVLLHIRNLKNKLQPIAKENKVSNTPLNNDDQISPKEENVKYVRSAPTVSDFENFQAKQNHLSSAMSGDFVPLNIIKQATFYHCMSVIAFLIQFRSGRSLFPVLTSLRKRFIGVQDFIQSVVYFLEDLEQNDSEVDLTYNGKQQFLEILKILKSVNVNVQSSRSAERSPSSVTYSCRVK